MIGKSVRRRDIIRIRRNTFPWIKKDSVSDLSIFPSVYGKPRGPVSLPHISLDLSLCASASVSAVSFDRVETGQAGEIVCESRTPEAGGRGRLSVIQAQLADVVQRS